MQALKQRKKLVLVSLLIAIILVISVVIIQNTPAPSSTPSPSPAPTGASPKPTITATPIATATPTATSASTSILQSTPAPSLYPGEVSLYQGLNLTPISDYIKYLTEHPDVAIAGAQNIDKATYHLAITGLVRSPVNYTYNDVVGNFNSTLQVATLPCVEGWSVTMLWQGVPISDLLQRVGVGPNATTLIFFASDGYSTSLPWDYVVQNNIMIAYKMNNVTLTPQLGWPFFLVANNQYGYKWIEWLTEINVSNDSNYLGYWESRGYPNDATVNDPNTASPFSNAQFVLPVSIISFACIIIAAAIYVMRAKLKKLRKSNTAESTPSIDVPSASGRQSFYSFFKLQTSVFLVYTNKP
jgi:DMSO/TMAO reductase YedYZ molybdopterin-dependent catalytic subunit